MEALWLDIQDVIVIKEQVVRLEYWQAEVLGVNVDLFFDQKRQFINIII